MTYRRGAGPPPWASYTGPGAPTATPTDSASAQEFDKELQSAYWSSFAAAHSTGGPPPWASSFTSVPTSTTASSQAASTGTSKVEPPPSPTSEPSHSGPLGPNNPSIKIVMAVIVPILLITCGVLLACCLRRRRRRKQVLHNEVMAEFKHQNRDGPAQAAPPYTASPETSQAAAMRSEAPLATPAPVVITEMAPAMGGAYFTGIDTSDVVSVTSNNNHLSSGYAFDPDHGDEPPPPYRPRSVPPISRETSLRLSEYVQVRRTQLTPPPEAQEGRTRSPFDDPDNVVHGEDDDDDDDDVSMVSGRGGRVRDGPAHGDHMSDVSDMSYQDEPTTTRQSV